jgi:hypothetical protein
MEDYDLEEARYGVKGENLPVYLGKLSPNTLYEHVQKSCYWQRRVALAVLRGFVTIFAFGAPRKPPFLKFRKSGDVAWRAQIPRDYALRCAR